MPRVHNLYFVDDCGNLGSKRLKAKVSAKNGVLSLKADMHIPLEQIEKCGIREAANGRKYVGIDVRGPAINRGVPTELRISHKSFLGKSKEEYLIAFAQELNRVRLKFPFYAVSESAVEKLSNHSLIQASYTLNLSFLISRFHRSWYSYESKQMVYWRTALLMAVNSLANGLGILIYRVPRDNHRLSRNFVLIGLGRGTADIAYMISNVVTFAVPGWLVVHLCQKYFGA